MNGTSNAMSGNNATLFGKAVAMNKYKNGSLQILAAKGTTDANAFKNFGNGLCISEKDHEEWYGDKTIAQKMKGEQLVTYYRNPLTIMLLGSARFDHQDNIAYIKKQPKPVWPKLVHAFCSGLEVLDLTQSSISSKRTMEVLACAIDNPIKKCTIKVLNLSKNHINKEGAKIFSEVLAKNDTITSLDLSGNLFGVSGTQALAKALKENTTIEHLSLYSNVIDVDGARALKETLLVNNTLKYLDVGSNRLREKGLLSISEGIVGNKNSALTGLGLRFNYIRDDGADKFFEEVFENTKIETVYIRNN